MTTEKPMTTRTEVATVVEQQPMLDPESARLSVAIKEAKMLAMSTLVPAEFQNNPSNCMIAAEMARRIGASVMMVMQNIDIIHGRPAWRAKFAIATINACGRFSALRYRFFGTQGRDDWGCQALATELATGEVLEGPPITIALAKSEGWASKNGSKWKTMPELMLRYRAGSWFASVYAPELLMGLRTSEEEQDIGATTASVNKRPSAIADANRQIRDARKVEKIEAEPVETQRPTVTFAEVMDMINKAQDGEALDVAEMRADDVQADDQRAELMDAIAHRRADLEAPR